MPSIGLLIEELVARLEDTHAIVTPGSVRPPPPDLPIWDPGLACLIDDRGRPVVYYVDPGFPASRAGIAPGMTVVSVDGAETREVLERWMSRQRTYVGGRVVDQARRRPRLHLKSIRGDQALGPYGATDSHE